MALVIYGNKYGDPHGDGLKQLIQREVEVDINRLSKKFFEGLFRIHGITKKMFIDDGWKYCGGSPEERRKKYFFEMFPDRPLPPQQHVCVCGVTIIRNRFITNRLKTQIITIGSCCCQKFLPTKDSKSCEICGKIHRNSKNNKCKECNEKERLAQKIANQTKCDYCLTPHRNRVDNFCNDCRIK